MIMKKILATILSFVSVCAMATSLVACDEEKEIINAYDIAVSNGFVGTEEEWLSSLKGANGADGAGLDINAVYEKAVAEGYDKGYLAFLKEYLSVEMQEDNDTEMIAQNISSVVSVCAGFKTTKIYQQGWPVPATKQQVTYSASEGSGVIVSLNKQAGNAYVITNYHVVSDASSDGENGISDCIYLYLYGARERFATGKEDLDGDGVITEGVDRGDIDGDGIKAKFVGGAAYYDIAILEISGSEYLKNSEATSAKLGDSETVRQGEKVFAIGNANGLGISVTAGVLSVPSENITMSALDGSNKSQSFRVMRTDAAINHGNSGGALFNAKGELIGITNAKNVNDETDALGYALPITQVSYVVNNIMANDKGKVQVVWLGITTTVTASKSVIRDGAIVIEEQITVSEVISDTASGYKPGLGLEQFKVGDILKTVTIGGQTYAVTKNYRVGELMLNARVGEKITFKLVREGKETQVEVTPTEKDLATRK
jgi:S1-C subfamily serine protease